MSASNSLQRTIIKLPRSVINRIAAGEVVQRPSGALKELVENSIDASATTISVTIQEGGLSVLKITDNGHGINPIDFPLLCERFATSKLSTYNDLMSIATFGFRGEALSSLTYVANVNVTSMVNNSAKASIRERKLAMDRNLLQNGVEFALAHQCSAVNLAVLAAIGGDENVHHRSYQSSSINIEKPQSSSSIGKARLSSLNPHQVVSYNCTTTIGLQCELLLHYLTQYTTYHFMNQLLFHILFTQSTSMTTPPTAPATFSVHSSSRQHLPAHDPVQLTTSIARLTPVLLSSLLDSLSIIPLPHPHQPSHHDPSSTDSTPTTTTPTSHSISNSALSLTIPFYLDQLNAYSIRGSATLEAYNILASIFMISYAHFAKLFSLLIHSSLHSISAFQSANSPQLHPQPPSMNDTEQVSPTSPPFFTIFHPPTLLSLPTHPQFTSLLTLSLQSLLLHFHTAFQIHPFLLHAVKHYYTPFSAHLLPAGQTTALKSSLIEIIQHKTPPFLATNPLFLAFLSKILNNIPPPEATLQPINYPAKPLYIFSIDQQTQDYLQNKFKLSAIPSQTSHVSRSPHQFHNPTYSSLTQPTITTPVSNNPINSALLQHPPHFTLHSTNPLLSPIFTPPSILTPATNPSNTNLSRSCSTAQPTTQTPLSDDFYDRNIAYTADFVDSIMYIANSTPPLNQQQPSTTSTPHVKTHLPKETAGLPGTTITATNLFANTPQRLAALGYSANFHTTHSLHSSNTPSTSTSTTTAANMSKEDKKEANKHIREDVIQCINVVSGYSMHYPHIAFELKNQSSVSIPGLSKDGYVVRSTTPNVDQISLWQAPMDLKMYQKCLSGGNTVFKYDNHTNQEQERGKATESGKNSPAQTCPPPLLSPSKCTCLSTPTLSSLLNPIFTLPCPCLFQNLPTPSTIPPFFTSLQSIKANQGGHIVDSLVPVGFWSLGPLLAPYFKLTHFHYLQHLEKLHTSLFVLQASSIAQKIRSHVLRQSHGAKTDKSGKVSKNAKSSSNNSSVQPIDPYFVQFLNYFPQTETLPQHDDNSDNSNETNNVSPQTSPHLIMNMTSTQYELLTAHKSRQSSSSKSNTATLSPSTTSSISSLPSSKSVTIGTVLNATHQFVDPFGHTFTTNPVISNTIPALPPLHALPTYSVQKTAMRTVAETKNAMADSEDDGGVEIGTHSEIDDHPYFKALHSIISINTSSNNTNDCSTNSSTTTFTPNFFDLFPLPAQHILTSPFEFMEDNTIQYCTNISNGSTNGVVYRNRLHKSYHSLLLSQLHFFSLFLTTPSLRPHIQPPLEFTFPSPSQTHKPNKNLETTALISRPQTYFEQLTSIQNSLQIDFHNRPIFDSTSTVKCDYISGLSDIETVLNSLSFADQCMRSYAGSKNDALNQQTDDLANQFSPTSDHQRQVSDRIHADCNTTHNNAPPNIIELSHQDSQRINSLISSLSTLSCTLSTSSSDSNSASKPPHVANSQLETNHRFIHTIHPILYLYASNHYGIPLPLILPGHAFNFLIKGYISHPAKRALNLSQSQLSLFVNNRQIQHKPIQTVFSRILGDTYKCHYWMYLSVAMPGSDIDVNVHPNKSQVHFLYENELLSLLNHLSLYLITDNGTQTLHSAQETLAVYNIKSSSSKTSANNTSSSINNKTVHQSPNTSISMSGSAEIKSDSKPKSTFLSRANKSDPKKIKDVQNGSNYGENGDALKGSQISNHDVVVNDDVQVKHEPSEKNDGSVLPPSFHPSDPTSVIKSTRMGDDDTSVVDLITPPQTVVSNEEMADSLQTPTILCVDSNPTPTSKARIKYLRSTESESNTSQKPMSIYDDSEGEDNDCASEKRNKTNNGTKSHPLQSDIVQPNSINDIENFDANASFTPKSLNTNRGHSNHALQNQRLESLHPPRSRFTSQPNQSKSHNLDEETETKNGSVQYSPFSIHESDEEHTNDGIDATDPISDSKRGSEQSTTDFTSKRELDEANTIMKDESRHTSSKHRVNTPPHVQSNWMKSAANPKSTPIDPSQDRHTAPTPNKTRTLLGSIAPRRFLLEDEDDGDDGVDDYESQQSRKIDQSAQRRGQGSSNDRPTTPLTQRFAGNPKPLKTDPTSSTPWFKVRTDAQQTNLKAYIGKGSLNQESDQQSSTSLFDQHYDDEYVDEWGQVQIYGDLSPNDGRSSTKKQKVNNSDQFGSNPPKIELDDEMTDSSLRDGDTLNNDLDHHHAGCCPHSFAEVDNETIDNHLPHTNNSIVATRSTKHHKSASNGHQSYISDSEGSDDDSITASKLHPDDLVQLDAPTTIPAKSTTPSIDLTTDDQTEKMKQKERDGQNSAHIALTTSQQSFSHPNWIDSAFNSIIPAEAQELSQMDSADHTSAQTSISNPSIISKSVSDHRDAFILVELQSVLNLKQAFLQSLACDTLIFPAPVSITDDGQTVLNCNENEIHEGNEVNNEKRDILPFFLWPGCVNLIQPIIMVSNKPKIINTSTFFKNLSYIGHCGLNTKQWTYQMRQSYKQLLLKEMNFNLRIEDYMPSLDDQEVKDDKVIDELVKAHFDENTTISKSPLSTNIASSMPDGGLDDMKSKLPNMSIEEQLDWKLSKVSDDAIIAHFGIDTQTPRVLVQFETGLYLLNMEILSFFFIYRICLQDFMNFKPLYFPAPVQIKPLLREALRHVYTVQARHEWLEQQQQQQQSSSTTSPSSLSSLSTLSSMTTTNPIDMVESTFHTNATTQTFDPNSVQIDQVMLDQEAELMCQQLLSHRDLLDEFFAIHIGIHPAFQSDNSADLIPDSSNNPLHPPLNTEHIYLFSLPSIIYNYVPPLAKLPMFLYQLAQSIDYTEEQPCIEQLSVLVSSFYQLSRNGYIINSNKGIANSNCSPSTTTSTTSTLFTSSLFTSTQQPTSTSTDATVTTSDDLSTVDYLISQIFLPEMKKQHFVPPRLCFQSSQLLFPPSFYSQHSIQTDISASDLTKMIQDNTTSISTFISSTHSSSQRHDDLPHVATRNDQFMQDSTSFIDNPNIPYPQCILNGTTILPHDGIIPVAHLEELYKVFERC